MYSTTLDAVETPRTTVRREFDPVEVRRLVAEAPHDVGIGGATLAAQAVTAGLVDEFQLLVNPLIVGGGAPWLPGGVRVDLELVDERRFANGVVFVRYTTR